MIAEVFFFFFFSAWSVRIQLGGKFRDCYIVGQSPPSRMAKTIIDSNMGVEPKIGVPKMDGENNGKPYEQMG